MGPKGVLYGYYRGYKGGGPGSTLAILRPALAIPPKGITPEKPKMSMTLSGHSIYMLST